MFASRISTSGFHFNKRTRMFEWDRYAAKLSGPSSIAPDPEKNQVYLPWPELKLPKTPSRESITRLLYAEGRMLTSQHANGMSQWTT